PDPAGGPATGWSTGSGCGGETEVGESGVAGRCGVAGQDERPGSLGGAAGGLERGCGRGQELVGGVEQRGGTVGGGGGGGGPREAGPGGGELVAGVGVAG